MSTCKFVGSFYLSIYLSIYQHFRDIFIFVVVIKWRFSLHALYIASWTSAVVKSDKKSGSNFAVLTSHLVSLLVNFSQKRKNARNKWVISKTNKQEFEDFVPWGKFNTSLIWVVTQTASFVCFWVRPVFSSFVFTFYFLVLFLPLFSVNLILGMNKRFKFYSALFE